MLEVVLSMMMAKFTQACSSVDLSLRVVLNSLSQIGNGLSSLRKNGSLSISWLKPLLLSDLENLLLVLYSHFYVTNKTL